MSTKQSIPTKRRPLRRCGFTLVECLVAAAMLMAVMALVTQLFAWDARERREAWRRQVAQQEAANVLEELSGASRPLTDEALASVALSAEAASWLPAGKVQVSVASIDAPAPGQRIDVAVTWRLDNGDLAAPVKLRSWAFDQESSR